jgi:hypothetical protein
VLKSWEGHAGYGSDLSLKDHALVDDPSAL